MIIQLQNNKREKTKNNTKEDNKIISSNNESKNALIDNHNLTQIEYYDYEKNITKDINCYYRCLSYYFRGSESYHLEFRKLISEIF